MLINYLPKFISEIEEIKSIMQTSQLNINDINIELEKILNNFFIEDSDLNAIKRYEKILNIFPKHSDTNDIRKDNIIIKYNKILPFTLENLILMLNSILGEGNYKLNLEYEKFNLNILISLNKRDLKDSIFEFLDKTIPANIIINLSLDYNTWKYVKKNSWKEICGYKFIDLRENEEIRKK